MKILILVNYLVIIDHKRCRFFIAKFCEKNSACLRSTRILKTSESSNLVFMLSLVFYHRISEFTNR